MTVKVKICGNRRPEDVVMALGADALGFVVASPRSHRNLLLGAAREMVRKVPPFVETVAVTSSRNESELRRIALELNPTALQVQGVTDVDLLRRVGETVRQRLIAGVAVQGEDALALARLLAQHCDAILLDSKAEGRVGGTGKVHDWKLSRRIRDALHPYPVILAGGLSPNNVRDAIRTVQPWGVDVASGVEEKGSRSESLVRSFLEEARHEDR